jgi:hypothetical protein
MWLLKNFSCHCRWPRRQTPKGLALATKNQYIYPMSVFHFSTEHSCPNCNGKITQAEQREEYEPIVVVVCPHCRKLLWRPGLDDSSRLFIFDPNADSGGI